MYHTMNGNFHDECGVGFVVNLNRQPSNRILKLGIESVINLTHRGAISADGKTGDGAGIMTEIPRELFGIDGKTGAAMIFMQKAKPCHALVEKIIAWHGMRVIRWRQVPCDQEALGAYARVSQPDIWQAFIIFDGNEDSVKFEQKLYLARKHVEKESKLQDMEVYIPSCSCRTMVYKGLFTASQLDSFYEDLKDPGYKTGFTIFHQRYSTNTYPTWNLAQPFRMLAHNGEINTLRGNINWMQAREPELASRIWGDEIDLLKPVIMPDMSDSAALDNVVELLTMSGREVMHGMIMLVPEAWEHAAGVYPDLAGFYKFHEFLTEPWDGPAAVVFSDGRFVGAALDRNGLRPFRYTVTSDGVIIAGSETGMVDIEPERVSRHGRLAPGRIMAIDIERGALLLNDQVKNINARRKPYGDWLKANTISVIGSPNPATVPQPLAPVLNLRCFQAAFGYTTEEISQVLRPMAQSGKEPVGSMGDDTPLSVLSDKNRLLFSYFKQLFAQVTNPPIDHIREHIVTSLNTLIGPRGNLLEESPNQARMLLLESPVITDTVLRYITSRPEPWFATETINAVFPISDGEPGMKRTLDALVSQACAAVKSGKTILVISDRKLDSEHVPIPSLLCVGAVHHGLIREGIRMRANIIIDSGEPREVHHFAALLAYGASAVNPYLAYETVKSESPAYETNYISAVETGILKIMSKMGISVLESYRGAQLFEAIGLARDLIDEYFPNTASKAGGVGIEVIAGETISRHKMGFPVSGEPKLAAGGYYRYRKDGEYHAFNPEMVHAMHDAVTTGRWPLYEQYSTLIKERSPTAFRDLLDFKALPGTQPIPIEDVEPVTAIFPRFTTGAMSFGALSREAHETLAVAMNRIGGKSDSGEGGEDTERYAIRKNGDWANSAIKQVASGRFGVTPEYLMSAKEIEIKIAQGSKPGEGGQLPGHKVSAEIAALRHSVPGVSLISPPPHHDIYSIEDLAQLIYDLRQVNPKAKIAVKLVAESGVGVIACGVAKAHADVIQISGHDGGTGASPLSSIKNAGSAWELGLAETHVALLDNGLRRAVILRVDGGFKTGRDVVIAAMLGAQEYGFGTAALVAAGCVMARQCHANTCPVGITSQDPKYRAKYTGTPERVINFFTFIAREVREILASLGVRRLGDVVGRADLLKIIDRSDHPKTRSLLLESVIEPVYQAGSKDKNEDGAQLIIKPEPCPLDERILTEGREAINGVKSVKLFYGIKNVHRAAGARVSGTIANRYGDRGLPEGVKLECVFRGTAGQSFGAFCINGMRLVLIGQANDYAGKGMAGGEIIIRPPEKALYKSNINVIIGNTVLYGATGGSFFACGQAGERFAVRNSGAVAVVEGTGDHACEYMTGGVVVVLGPTGYNFGAGMTNGAAYVLDNYDAFESRYNPELVLIERIEKDEDALVLRSLVERHKYYTGSVWAGEILDNWNEFISKFWKIRPRAAPAKTEELLTAKE